MHKLTGHPTVDAIGQLHFDGNITPHTWYSHVRYTNKRGTYTDHLAIAILAEIVYWHRPASVYDEATGKQIGWRKKFKSDKLRKSYAALSQKLGATDKQIRESTKLLSELGLIDLEFRVDTNGEVRVGNVMYIGLNPERVQEITFTALPLDSSEPITEIVDTPLTEMGDRGIPSHRNGVDPLTEMGEPTIYKNTPEITPPLPPQGERESERKFGFEIKENSEPTAHHSTSFDKKALVTHEVTDIFIEATVPPLARTDKFFTGKTRDQQKYDRWAETAHPALVYGEEDTPWLEPPTRAKFVVFNQAFLDWHTARDMQKFHKQDRFQAEGDFKGALIKDPERCSTRWDEYHKHMVTHAATAAARVNSGLEISQTEKEKFAKHQRAFIGVTAQTTESIDSKILDAAKSTPTAEPPQLESVATVSDDIWDTVAATTEQEQAQFISPPDDGQNVSMYQQNVKSEDSDYFRKLHEKQQNNIPTESAPITSLEEAQAQIHSLISSREMPRPTKAQRQRISDEERERSKLLQWAALLESGLPSVIADAKKQMAAQGYQIVDGQIVEVDF